jgi:hypothetical protein
MITDTGPGRVSRRRFITRPMVLITTLALALVSLSSGALAWHPWTRQPDGVQLAPGVTLVIPKGYDQTRWKLSATRSTPQAVGSYRSTKLIPLVPARDYHASPSVPHGTKLVFALKKGLTSPVFEAFFDPRTNMWIPEQTSYNPGTGVATATIAHLSIHDLFTWPTDYLKSLFQGALKNLFGDWAIGKRPPVCGNPNGVRMYYTGGASSVLPCHGATILQAPGLGSLGAADITVKLVNNRNYPIDVSYPRIAQATTSDPGSVAAQIGAAITKIANAPSGQKLILVPGGATATITLPRAQPPFRGLKISADFDGEAYLVGILGTALDELSVMDHVKLEDLTRNLLYGWSGEQALYRIQSELTVTSFSPAEVKTIADVGMDAILTAFQDNSNAILVSAIKVTFALVNELIQSITGLVDNLTGQANHTYTFAPYGTIWNPSPQPATSCPSAAIIEQALAAQASWWRPGYTVPATDITCAGPYVLAGFQESPLIGARSLLEQQTSGLKLLTTGSGPICTTSPGNALPGQVTYVPPQYGHALNCVP